MGFLSFCILSRGHLCFMLGYLFYKEIIYNIKCHPQNNAFLNNNKSNLFLLGLNSKNSTPLWSDFQKLHQWNALQGSLQIYSFYKERIRNFEQWQEVNYLPIACGFCKAVSNAISSHPNGFIEIRLWFWVQ